MPNDNNVDYDTTGVPVSSVGDGENNYVVKISSYFYTKLNSIVHNNEFTNEEISDFGLSVSNGNIDISSTKKLIKYLKGLIYSNVNKLDSKIDEKLDKSNYVVDTQFESNSTNPLTNKVITDKFSQVDLSLSNKSNLGHTHSVSEVNGLDSNLVRLEGSVSSKAESVELSRHINNKQNPHNVTLYQLGVEDSGWDDYCITQSYLPAYAFPRCRKFGKLVILSFNAEVTKNVTKNKTFFTLKSEYRPSTNIYTFAYLVGSGQCMTCMIGTDGTVIFGSDMASGAHIRVYDCFFTN